MALILHLDTSAATGTVMLAEDGLPLLMRQSFDERNHAGNINLLVDDVFRHTGKGINDIDALCVCSGPGSYTGLRIGLATAKGFCYISGKPLILHNKLDLLLRQGAATKPGLHTYLAVLPARTGEYYVAAQGNITIQPSHILVGDLQQKISFSTLSKGIIGPAEEEYQELDISGDLQWIPFKELDIDIWAYIAQHDFGNKMYSDLAYSTPDYLKPVYISKAGENTNKKMDA